MHQNHAEEQKREAEFWSLQDDILKEFGQESPEPPKLSVSTRVMAVRLLSELIVRSLGAKHHPNFCYVGMATHQAGDGQVAFSRHL